MAILVLAQWHLGLDVDAIVDYLARSRDAVQAAIDDAAFTGAIRDIAEVAAHALRSGGKLLLAGNGGSAGDAQHLAGEMLSRLYYDRAPCARARPRDYGSRSRADRFRRREPRAARGAAAPDYTDGCGRAASALAEGNVPPKPRLTQTP